MTEARIYWEERARLYAAQGAGLRAVCSYGMPSFHNLAIHLTQRLALLRWLRVRPGCAVLDVGCGVGRWSRLLARRGAQVTGVDLSATMVEEARRRALAEGLASRCSFVVEDLAQLDLRRRFPLVLGVTVLQHILDPTRFRQALHRLATHLAPDGRLILLEAAPTRATARCDSPIFSARSEDAYREAFALAGLRCTRVGGVDPAPFRVLFLPMYRTLPAPLAVSGLAAATLASLPLDALLGRVLVGVSWHKVFELTLAER